MAAKKMENDTIKETENAKSKKKGGTLPSPRRWRVATTRTDASRDSFCSAVNLIHLNAARPKILRCYFG